MAGPFHTDTFDNISPEKRERILKAAAKLLGREGPSRVRMGDIAKEAGVSHGSLFSYFATKDDLVRAVIQRGEAMERERFTASEAETFAQTLASVLRAAWSSASAEGELISLWLSLSLMENRRFSDDIFPLEVDGAERWKSLVAKGMDEGAVKERVDPRVAAFLLDAVTAQLMKSRASDLEGKKLALFFEDPEAAPALIAATLAALFA